MHLNGAYIGYLNIDFLVKHMCGIVLMRSDDDFKKNERSHLFQVLNRCYTPISI